jgi:hypothetical protein
MAAVGEGLELGDLRSMSQAPRFKETLIGVDHFATRAAAGGTARLSRTFPDRLTNAWVHLSASPSDCMVTISSFPMRRRLGNPDKPAPRVQAGRRSSDVMMPGVDRFTLARLAKTRQPLLKIIYISGYSAQPRDVGEIFGPLLPKPFRSAILKQAMSEALST